MMAAQPWLFPELDIFCDPARGPACAVVRGRGRPRGGVCKAVEPQSFAEQQVSGWQWYAGPAGEVCGPGRLGKKETNCKGLKLWGS